MKKTVDNLRSGMEAAGHRTYIPPGSAKRTPAQLRAAIAAGRSNDEDSKHLYGMAVDLAPREQHAFNAYAAADPTKGPDFSDYAVELRSWWNRIQKNEARLEDVPDSDKQAFLKYLVDLKAVVAAENERLKPSGWELKMGDDWGDIDIMRWDPTHVQMQRIGTPGTRRNDGTGASDRSSPDSGLQEPMISQAGDGGTRPVVSTTATSVPPVDVELPNLPMVATAVEPAESDTETTSLPSGDPERVAARDSFLPVELLG